MSPRNAWLTALALTPSVVAHAAPVAPWLPASAESLRPIDDDVARHVATPGYFDDLEISYYRFSENGFVWQLVRFRSVDRPHGPLWIVPHDDENAAFDAMIAAIREHGGLGIAVNSAGSRRLQVGRGECGARRSVVGACDPNRNFDARTPLFTAAFLDQRPAGQPVIALHTNSPGFAGDKHGGRGDTTILDREAFRRGRIAPRAWAVLAAAPRYEMANYDSFILTPFSARASRPTDAAVRCGQAIAAAGISFWHERVDRSDGSMSNYLTLNRPDVSYFNAESRAERDPALAAVRHRVMIASYLHNCAEVNEQLLTTSASAGTTP